jgi:tetratricopeptide (TPR) repeat protein
VIELLLQAEQALTLGLLDRAETLYRQVATADPRNAIAVVGLARVALERGGEAEALGEARRALAIDPENSAAQRMTQRLEEVLRYRGAEVTAAAPRSPAPAAQPEPDATGATPAEPALEAPPPAVPIRRRSLVDRLLRRP